MSSIRRVDGHAVARKDLEASGVSEDFCAEQLADEDAEEEDDLGFGEHRLG
jgi:hypothetical protein